MVQSRFNWAIAWDMYWLRHLNQSRFRLAGKSAVDKSKRTGRRCFVLFYHSYSLSGAFGVALMFIKLGHKSRLDFNFIGFVSVIV